MKIQLAILWTCIFAPVLGLADPLWELDIEQIEGIAIQAVHEKFPDVPKDDLASETGVSITCSGDTALDRYRNRPSRPVQCQASVSITMKSTVLEKRYTDENGKCRMVRESGPITVQVFEDGSAHVGSLGMSGLGEHHEPCPEDFAAEPTSPLRIAMDTNVHSSG